MPQSERRVGVEQKPDDHHNGDPQERERQCPCQQAADEEVWEVASRVKRLPERRHRAHEQGQSEKALVAEPTHPIEPLIDRGATGCVLSEHLVRFRKEPAVFGGSDHRDRVGWEDVYVFRHHVARSAALAGSARDLRRSFPQRSIARPPSDRDVGIVKVDPSAEQGGELGVVVGKVPVAYRGCPLDSNLGWSVHGVSRGERRESRAFACSPAAEPQGPAATRSPSAR
ncbi:MAG: hypothetical protein KatS3mg015_0452 [Fimbriimonadales bacterium]|nr:MAG: hypothetical protein KatS3mg015_0452 [Fimbriimonadales bacterium]